MRSGGVVDFWYGGRRISSLSTIIKIDSVGTRVSLREFVRRGADGRERLECDCRSVGFFSFLMTGPPPSLGLTGFREQNLNAQSNVAWVGVFASLLTMIASIVGCWAATSMFFVPPPWSLERAAVSGTLNSPSKINNSWSPQFLVLLPHFFRHYF